MKSSNRRSWHTYEAEVGAEEVEASAESTTGGAGEERELEDASGSGRKEWCSATSGKLFYTAQMCLQNNILGNEGHGEQVFSSIFTV